MTRNKPPKYIQDKRKQERHTETRTHPAKSVLLVLIKSPWSILVVLATAAGALALVPRVSVSDYQTVRSYDPFGTVFQLSNDGLLPIHDIDVICRIDNGSMDGIHDQIRNVSARVPLDARILSAGHTVSLPCERALHTEGLKSVRATILVTFRPDFLWWQWHRDFPIKGLKSDNGTWIWERLAN